ncbi:ABC transporter ATP-binding protein [Neobacillus sp. D3-1R]|uniref:ABC transporter ATP-binding protein n=1 Tax=Neobacillus sp. D3-1R TaxID=3445778 RepID=UPI003FA08D80
MTEVVSVKNVTKTFKDKIAVKNISFSIQKGEVVAILGPNGAGKTTMISMILGLLKPSQGNVTLFGRLPHEKSVREKVGTMLQEVSVMPGLTVKELLHMIRNYYPDPLPLEDLIEITRLTPQDMKSMAEKLSGGQKRRLSFALALAGNPDLIIFDEPTVGMDLHSRNRFWQTVHLLAEQGKTIIFTTHYIQEADDVAERVLLFKNGEIIEDGTPAEIKKRISKKSVTFTVSPEKSLENLYRHPMIDSIYRKNDRVVVHTENTDKVLEVLFSEKLGVSDIRVEGGKLEEAFEQLFVEHKEVM